MEGMGGRGRSTPCDSAQLVWGMRATCQSYELSFHENKSYIVSLLMTVMIVISLHTKNFLIYMLTCQLTYQPAQQWLLSRDQGPKIGRAVAGVSCGALSLPLAHSGSSWQPPVHHDPCSHALN